MQCRIFDHTHTLRHTKANIKSPAKQTCEISCHLTQYCDESSNSHEQFSRPHRIITPRPAPGHQHKPTQNISGLTLSHQLSGTGPFTHNYRLSFPPAEGTGAGGEGEWSEHTVSSGWLTGAFPDSERHVLTGLGWWGVGWKGGGGGKGGDGGLHPR